MADIPPYNKVIPEKMILSDYLAVERTVMANQRSLLACIRTALSLIVAGASFIKFSGYLWVETVGWVFIPLGAMLIIVGAVAIAQALVPMAQAAGFDVSIIDPRRAFATEARFPHGELIEAWPDKALPDLSPDRHTAVVTLTHDAKPDEMALELAVRSPAFYVGALGSRNTHAKRLERMKQAGVPDSMLAKIHAPIGLPIGARTPADIAVSILSEIVAAKNGMSMA